MLLQSTGGAENSPLIIYVLLESTEASNEANFQYYLREGISEDDGCLHIILTDPKRVGALKDVADDILGIQKSSFPLPLNHENFETVEACKLSQNDRLLSEANAGSQEFKTLPRLSFGNAKYVRQKVSSCIWGAVGGLLGSSDIDASRFTHYIVTNSALRGPFVPAYFKVRDMKAAPFMPHIAARLEFCCKMLVYRCLPKSYLSMRNVQHSLGSNMHSARLPLHEACLSQQLREYMSPIRYHSPRLLSAASILLQALNISWPAIFTRRLTAVTKLVGPVISCETIDWPPAVSEELRERDVPHLSHNTFAFDKVTSSVILEKDYQSLPD